MGEHENDKNQLLALIGYRPKYYIYIKSYKNAFDILYDSIILNGVRVDTVSYPMLFLARHIVEIGLKDNIERFSRFINRESSKIKKGHKLTALFNDYTTTMMSAFEHARNFYDLPFGNNEKDFFIEQSSKIESLVGLLESFDKDSTAFRYPYDNSGCLYFSSSDRVNLHDIKALLDETTDFILFDYFFSEYSDYIQYIDDMEKEYQKIMLDYYGCPEECQPW